MSLMLPIFSPSATRLAMGDVSSKRGSKGALAEWEPYGPDEIFKLGIAKLLLAFVLLVMFGLLSLAVVEVVVQLVGVLLS